MIFEFHNFTHVVGTIILRLGQVVLLLLHTIEPSGGSLKFWNLCRPSAATIMNPDLARMHGSVVLCNLEAVSSIST